MLSNSQLSSKSKRKRELPRPGELVFGFMSLFSLACIVRNSEVAIEYMTKGLSLCATTVIPSLFPFMVISELIVSSGMTKPVGRLFAKPFRLLFGISGDGGCAVILGMLCGFPIGAKTAVSLFNSGKIEKNELSKLMTFCNMPSSAFLISAVGTSLFGCHEFGVMLYVITLLSCLLIGMVSKFLFRRKSIKSTPGKKNEQPTAHTPLSSNASESHTVGASAFPAAITRSAFAMLSVCAFVIFFSTLIGTLEAMFSEIPISREFSALLFGFFELSGGVSRAAACAPASSGIYLCAFLTGWSGLSVHFQIMSICGDCPISFRPYFLAKLAHGILNVLLLKLALLCFRPDFVFRGEGVSRAWQPFSKNFALPILCLFAGALLFAFLCKCRQTGSK